MYGPGVGRAERPKIDVLHLDEHLVVVDKPAGLAVHRGWAPERDVALRRTRDTLGRRVYPVHRLDKPTSGALVFGLASESTRAMHEAFEAGLADKIYLAIVRGIVPEEGVIDAPVKRGEDGPLVEAETHYRRLAYVEHGNADHGHRYSVVEVRPKTGRTHQIRRHFRHLKHPIVWDRRYGRGRFDGYAQQHFGLDRMALHCHRLRFPHPAGGEDVRVEAPLADLTPVLHRMGLSEYVWRDEAFTG